MKENQAIASVLYGLALLFAIVAPCLSKCMQSRFGLLDQTRLVQLFGCILLYFEGDFNLHVGNLPSRLTPVDAVH